MSKITIDLNEQQALTLLRLLDSDKFYGEEIVGKEERAHNASIKRIQAKITSELPLTRGVSNDV